MKSVFEGKSSLSLMIDMRLKMEGSTMKNKLIFNKYCDINLKDPLKYIDADINGCVYVLYELDDLKYKVDYYLNEGKRTYYFSLNKEIDFFQIIHEHFLFVSDLSKDEEDNAFLYDQNGKCSETVYCWGELDVGLVDWISVGKDEAVIGTEEDIFWMHLQTREQCKVTLCDENKHRLKLDHIFTSGDRVFGLSNETVYVSSISGK
ncbi:hypothetical protein [Bacillus badius]|uniref:DUF5050 domain-containing protein n=1 Tax=Bacillus badius TaxID=1455 RepID=A0ABR5AZI7_BACBA|nr:hypothetical protein [Bacillus badius]KIL80151.1 hypothetical protein SD77_2605 [Bacillus badius]MED4718519.1 hypothetical protein [Bacillus badius]